MPITFNRILMADGIDPADVRLVRHHDTRRECRIDPYGLWRRDPALLEKYQSIQRKKRPFRIGKPLATFVRTPSDKTLFVGLYMVNGEGTTHENEIDPSTDLPCPGRVFTTQVKTPVSRNYKAVSSWIGVGSYVTTGISLLLRMTRKWSSYLVIPRTSRSPVISRSAVA